MTKRREIIFTLTGILLLLLIAGIAVYLITFLLDNVRAALDQNLITNQEVIRFNLKGLEELNLIK